MIRSRPIGLVLGVVMVVVLGGCGGSSLLGDSSDPQPTSTATPKPTLILWGPTGTSKMVERIKPLAEAAGLPYEMRVYDGPSADAGIKGVLNGSFDAMIIMQDPNASFAAPLLFREYLRVPVAIYADPRLNLESITWQQAQQIFSGEITNWSEVGGPDQPIVVFVQEDDDTMTVALRDTLLEGGMFGATARIINDEFALLGIVESIEGAVGYASLSGEKYLELSSSTEYADPLLLDGLSPSDPAYPIVSPVGFAYLPEQEDFLMPLFDWTARFVRSDAVVQMVTQLGVRLSPTEESGS